MGNTNVLRSYRLWRKRNEYLALLASSVPSTDQILPAETVICPETASFRINWNFPDNVKTYAHCDRLEDAYQVGTECSGSNVLYTEWSAGTTDLGFSSTFDCGTRDCVTVRVYDYYDGGDGSGLRWLIDCDESIGLTSNVGKLFLENPIVWDKASETIESETSSTESETSSTESGASSTESESSTTEVDSASPTDTETLPSATKSSEPTDTHDPDDEGGDAPKTGVIAGAVVGSLAGIALIFGALILGFRVGRRSRDDAEDPHRSFRDTLRSLPRPTIAWKHPEPKSPTYAIQPIFVGDCDPIGASRPTPIPSHNETNSPVTSPTYASGAETKRENELPASPSSAQTGNLVLPEGHELLAITGDPVTELPAGPDSQGWAVTGAQQHPYEMDSTTGHRPPVA
ncbi:hypothetical protein F53441_13215 [Fusarium austroafricanum]|uniref:Uncharacterized protein n=1 Tax=Fusarium austroafricanum TaxID=2364996 RepID=A0A8H4NS51_9HYPO|nr:hypothetical protein F53441_13215 [Fusarium austroafricanum]